VAFAVVAGLFDAVGVVAGALGDAGVAALATLVQVLAAGDVRDGRAQGVLVLVREKAGSATRRRTVRMVLLHLTRSGSMPAAVAAVQIRALIVRVGSGGSPRSPARSCPGTSIGGLSRGRAGTS
jgi:hypothetical protein